MKKILMIAAEYPPCLSAGVQRTYHFSENLYKLGWQPLILTAHERIYKKLDNNIAVSPIIAQHCYRAFAVDASVHLAIKGKYFDFLENPDKFSSWYYHGCWLGKKVIKIEKPDILWSTFPVSTSHRIALKLKANSGIPWVADFRDPQKTDCEDNYYKKNITDLAKRIDQETVASANALVFATDKMKQLYQKAYPSVNPNKFHVIENGYDESLFIELKKSSADNSRFTLLYSGELYLHGRDPIPLFKAISELIKEGRLDSKQFKLHFRGSGDGRTYGTLLDELEILPLVEFLPPISHKESLQEMMNSSALLVLQGKTFNNQIPGKVYEYIAANLPILGLVGENSATESLLKKFSHAHTAPEMNIEKIKQALIKAVSNRIIEKSDTTRYSRKSRSLSLATLLNNTFAETTPFSTSKV
jgi:glycosyltransferase involved in cell wall biosynthesis